VQLYTVGILRPADDQTAPVGFLEFALLPLEELDEALLVSDEGV
jgi:hypothetical protein